MCTNYVISFCFVFAVIARCLPIVHHSFFSLLSALSVISEKRGDIDAPQEIENNGL